MWQGWCVECGGGLGWGEHAAGVGGAAEGSEQVDCRSPCLSRSRLSSGLAWALPGF